MRGDSIMQQDKRCYVTGRAMGLDCHHIYHGNPNRSISDREGLWVWLDHDVHMKLHAHQSPYGGLDMILKQQCQLRYEAMGHSRDEFRKLIGKSYL